jgi:hypothetical protein
MYNRKGQNIAEYSILIALVIAAAVAMQVYVKRGIQGKMADAVSHAPTFTIQGGGTPITVNFKTKQYEPYYVDSIGNVSSKRDATQNITGNGEVNTAIGQELTVRELNAYDKTTWGNESSR